MSAPTRRRRRVDPPEPATPNRVEWFSGLGYPERHAIRHWKAGPNGQIAALCGVTSPMWSAVQIVGHGRVCHVCADRAVPDSFDEAGMP